MRFLSCFVLFISFSAFAQQSASDRYCDHLDFIAENSLPSITPVLQSQNEEDIMQLYGALTGGGPTNEGMIKYINLYNQAQEQRKSFEQFQALAQKEGLKIQPKLKYEYIKNYERKICGKAELKHRFEMTPDGRLSNDYNIFEKQFDPHGQPYNDDNDSGGAVQ